MYARNINTRYVRLIDCSPANVLRRDGVCVAAVSATDADKEGLGEAIALAHIVTLRTPAGGVVRINESDRNSKLRCLIGNKAPQLAKGPGMQTGPLRYSSPYPATNPLQIFQGDPAAGALGNGNYLFGNLMIDVSGEALFFAAALAQKPFSRAGAFGRKPGAKPSVSPPQAIQLTACKASIVTGVGNRYQPKINPEPVLDFSFWRLGNFKGSKEQPQAIPVKEIALTFPTAKQSMLALAAAERNGEPPIDGPDADELCAYVPGKDAPVKGDRTALPKDALPPPIQFVSVGHFGDEPDNDLSRKREFFADLDKRVFAGRTC
jgi:hypothetical protein